MTKEFEAGMRAREIGLHLTDNPYNFLEDEKHQEWEKGWKLEHWRLVKMGKPNATRAESYR